MEREFQKLGLNENEATIYMALLKMGPQTAGNIASGTKTKRSTTYLALNNLIRLGIVIEHYQNKKHLFNAEPPAQLKKLTNRMRRKVIQAELVLDNLIPSLEDMPKQNPVEEPQVSVRQGFSGIKNVLLEIAASKTSWYVFGSSTKLLQNLPGEDLKEILEEGEKLRQASGRPKIYFITDKGILLLPEFQKYAPERREIKILPQEIKSSSAYIIYEDKVAILHVGAKLFVAVIKSKEIVDVMRVTYHIIWERTPKLKIT